MFTLVNYHNGLVAFEMLLYAFLLSWHLPQRKKRWPFAGLFALLFIALAYFFPIIEATNHLYIGFLLYLSLFALLYFWIRFLYDIPRIGALFLALASYTLQNIASTLQGLPQNFFVAAGSSTPLWVNYLSDAVSFLLVLSFTFYLSARLQKYPSVVLPTRPVLFVTSLLLAVDIAFNLFVIFYGKEVTNLAYRLGLNILIIISGLTGLFILFDLLNETRLSLELQTTEKLWKEDQKQYRMAKDAMEQINIKAHDLKHQIHALAIGDKAISKETGQAIDQALLAYESHIVTGSEALDVLLSEKMPFCQKNGITLSVIADGKSLAFLSDSDLYSLFGNALDNAIEAVEKLPKKGEISLKVIREGAGVFVQVRNPYLGEIHFADGLPQSNKGDPFNHGFGSKSMSLLVQKYGGVMSIKNEDNIYSLNIVFPQAK
jgi:hypothetical protein